MRLAFQLVSYRTGRILDKIYYYWSFKNTAILLESRRKIYYTHKKAKRIEAMWLMNKARVVEVIRVTYIGRVHVGHSAIVAIRNKLNHFKLVKCIF